MNVVKALTLTQPWASLVILGVKRIETRSWSTHYRGPLAIHAAAGWTAADRELALDLMDAGLLPRALIFTIHNIRPDLPLGAVIGSVRLADVIPIDEDLADPRLARWWRDAEADLGDYSPGRFAWLLADPVPSEPTPARGALGLWAWR